MNEGKKDRREPIRTIKPKNPVAKNASAAIGGGAAGAHKDKKKAAKQGDVKHKKAEFAESYEAHLARQLNELSIDSLKSYKAKRQTQQDAAKAAVPNPRTGDKDWIDQAVRGINMNTAQRKINRKEKAVGEDIQGKSPFEAGAADAYYGRNFIHMVQDYGFKPGTPEFSEYVAGFHSEDGKDGKDYGNAKRSPVHARRITKTAEGFFGDMKQSFATGMADKLKKAIPTQYHKHYDFDSVKSAGDTKAMVAQARAAGHLKEQGVAEGNPWANVIHTTDRSAEKAQREQEHKKQAGLAAKVLKNHSQALDPKEIDLLTRYNLHHRGKPGVRLDNYDVKQAQQLIQNVLRFNEQGVAEAEGDAEGLEHLTPELAQHIAQQIDSEGAAAIVKSVEWGDGAADDLVQFIKHALTKFAGSEVQEDTHQQRSAEADKKFAEREAARKKNPGSASGDRIKELEKRYPAKESWTHDSLADELFEHERTYEERLQNQLNKLTKR